MKTVLVTRPIEEAGKLAKTLGTRGFRPLIEPLLTVTPLPENTPALEAAMALRPQLILVTSGRAIGLFAEMTNVRDIPLLAVGSASADHAAALGFPVAGWQETAEALIASVAQDYAPANGRLLYIRGEDITVDIAGGLEAKGFGVDSVILYRATPAQSLSGHCTAEMTKGNVAGALFFSQRTAETYANLVHKHGLKDAHRSMRGLCISEAVAGKLRLLPWHSLHSADKPDMEHMLAAAERIF
jgi:uroporphyrinogen-III synthase